MKKWIMINYDLGLKGEYESLYRFLDNHKALDCGNCNAVLQIDIKGNTFEEILNEVINLMKEKITFSQTDRIYLTFIDELNNMRGRFINGNRRRAIWEGYGDIKPITNDLF